MTPELFTKTEKNEPSHLKKLAGKCNQADCSRTGRISTSN